MFIKIAPADAATDDTASSDHGMVLELGVTGEREITEQTAHLGPAIGVEIEPIEDWLEIEFGAAQYRSQGAANWEFEVPFKKPFRLSGGIEVMPGLGPIWSHAAALGGHAKSAAPTGGILFALP